MKFPSPYAGNSFTWEMHQKLNMHVNHRESFVTKLIGLLRQQNFLSGGNKSKCHHHNYENNECLFTAMVLKEKTVFNKQHSLKLYKRNW
jgi:hypothetical protein